MSTNDTSYGVAATSERELTIDKLDAAIDTFFHALLRPAVLSQGDGQRGLTAGGCDGHHEMSVSGAAGDPVHSSGETDRCTRGRNQRLDGQRWVNSKGVLR